MFACIRSPRLPELAARVAADFSPRLQRYGADAVVLDVSGLGRLLGPPAAIAAEIARTVTSLLPASGFRHPGSGSPSASAPAPRSVSRYGLRVQAHPSEHGRLCADDARREARTPAHAPGAEWLPLQRAGVRVTVAPTQVGALLLSFAESPVTVVTADAAAALAPLPLRILQQFMAGIHGVSVLRKKGTPSPGASGAGTAIWPAWPACAHAFDVLRRWGLTTIGEVAGLPAADLAARMGQEGAALQRLARGCDPGPLVPDPDVPRFAGRMELEWPIDGVEPLSFVLARLLEPVSSALERADRGAAAIRLDLRLVDRTTHSRVLQFPAPMRDARVLRTLLLLDLESHPPAAAIDVVDVEIDPAPGRVTQYSLLERAMPSPETLATLTARLGALVGESRCGAPAMLDTHRPDAFDMRRFDGTHLDALSAARSGTAGRAPIVPTLRRFRPPVAVRVTIDRGRPSHVAIDRRGMPGGHVIQAAGPWRSSGDWWTRDRPWNRDEWDVELSDGAVCRLFREQGMWFMEGVVD